MKESKVFLGESETFGGRVVGKLYKEAEDLAKEYIEKLKENYSKN